MAPARMMQFIDQHIKDCSICQEDPDLSQEVEKIGNMSCLNPNSPRAFRAPNKSLTPEISPSLDEDEGEMIMRAIIMRAIPQQMVCSDHSFCCLLLSVIFRYSGGHAFFHLMKQACFSSGVDRNSSACV